MSPGQPSEPARQTVRREIRDRVAILTMNRPERRNAFNAQMYRELRDALAEVQQDDDLRVAVITGTHGAFSAGQDFSEMTTTPPDDGGPHPFPTFMDQLTAFDKPLIAAVNGVGVGLGLTMLLHCDLVYISRSARLRVPFVSLGVVPEAASSFLLPETIGYQNAADVLFTAAWIDAERASELGIAIDVVAEEKLLPVALKKAEEIAQHPLGALRHTKRLLLAVRAEAVGAARVREDAAFAERIGTPENLEAIQAFFAKRRR